VLTTLAAFLFFGSHPGAQPERLRAREIADFTGAVRSRPMLAALMLVIMFSTAGVRFRRFWAKLWISRRC